MSKLITSINGVRGRRIDIYDNKCVIKTDVTIGSVISHNATDGEKTIFYIDVTGVQFKESGLAIGFLQFETPSSQMNNLSNNFFSENTFTFEKQNDYMRKVYEFVVARIEGYKYGTISEAPISLYSEAEEELQKQMKAEAELREQQKQAEKKQLQEMIEQDHQNSAETNIILSFAEQASTLQSMTEILKLWKEFPEDFREAYTIISSKLESSARNERLYGKDEKAAENFVNWLKELS